MTDRTNLGSVFSLRKVRHREPLLTACPKEVPIFPTPDALLSASFTILSATTSIQSASRHFLLLISSSFLATHTTTSWPLPLRFRTASKYFLRHSLVLFSPR